MSYRSGETLVRIATLLECALQFDDCFVRCAVTCPAPFTYLPSVHGCYYVVTSNLEWLDAGLECRTIHKDAHLLVINDADEQLAITGFLLSIDSQYSSSLLAGIPWDRHGHRYRH